MRRWVVTGPAGAGKSVFTKHLARRGAAVIDADQLGHEVLARPEIQAAIGKNFGLQMVQGGVVDRQELGRLVFADPQALQRLNQITHPALAALADQRLTEAAAEGKALLAVLEAAVYFLWPKPPAVDLVIAVVASEAVRRVRLGSSGLDARSVADRLAAQRSMSDLWSGAGEMIVNEGSLAELIAAADRLLAFYLGPDGEKDPES